MKVTCNVIRDILPLYFENMASEDSCAMIEEHIDHCEGCKTYLEEMKAFSKLPVDTDIAPLLKIKSTLRKKKLQTAIFSMMLTAVMGVLIIAFLTAPEYLPYSKERISIKEIGNGSVLAIFSDEVSGYDINSYPTEDNIGYEYHLTTWNSIWNRRVSKSRVNNTILNPNGKAVAAVYYYQTDGSEDKLIYGNDANPNGGVVTLPRLFLTYYLYIAIILSMICAIIMILFRCNKKVINVTTKILLLPVSYLIGQFMMKGFTTTSYAGARDFFAILLIMIPMYIAFLAVMILIREYKRKKYE